jgi:hypothetical protein
MTEEERWSHLDDLDAEILKGGVILSEWCAFIVCQADTAFARGAHLASILTAVSGIETYLRSEHTVSSKEGLAGLIERTPLPLELKADLHKLRKYRNKWVHVGEPWDDESVRESPERFERELEEMAFFAARVLRRTIYANPWI